MIVASLVFCLGSLLGAGARSNAARQTAPLRISSVVMQSKLLHAGALKYPEAARKKDVQGIVKLDVVIAKNGSVKTVKATEGDKALAKAAVDAVKHWRYQPTMLNGKPIEVETEVDVRFTLKQPKPAPKPAPKSPAHN